jgi:hypothetical protein
MTQRSTMILAVGAIAIGGAIAWHVPRRPLELPEPQQQAHRDVFPESDFDAAKPGSAVQRLYASFGRTPSRGSSEASRLCVAFRYDPELHDGALVVLVEAGVIKQRWLTTKTGTPPECASLQLEEVDLTGWYAASAR